MKDHKTWKQVLNIIKRYEFPVVVVSATAKTTRQLIEAGIVAANGDLDKANEIATEIRARHIGIIQDFLKENAHAKNKLILESCLKNIDSKISKLKKLLIYTHRQNSLSPQLKDAIASIGEQLSSYLLAQCGLALDMPTQHIEARKIIKTDAGYGSAKPNLFLITQKCGSLETVMESGFIPVTGGFYGEAPDGTITTLGFEGSDYTAGLIGNAVNADKIEIWTDVSGIYTSDPNFIQNAKPIPRLSYLDATEMAYFGAKVLHPATLKPAQEKNIPVFVKNIFDPENAGTSITRDAKHDREVLALSFKKEIAVLTISAYETLMGGSFLSRIFSVIEKHHIAIDAVQTTEASITIALPDSPDLQNLSREYLDIGTLTLSQKKGIISLIGLRAGNPQKLVQKILNVLNGTNIYLLSFNKEKRLLTLVMDEENVVEVVQKIHDEIFRT